MTDLPRFDRNRVFEDVHAYVSKVFKQGRVVYVSKLQDFDNGHYRAIFDARYFTLAEGRTEPTRSQWNTLKKHMKRMDKTVFIFKEHGFLADGHAYIDFGFFLD